MRSVHLLAAVVVASSAGSPLLAQPAPGTLVRVTHDAACCNMPLVGTFVAATAESLWVRPAGAGRAAAPVALPRQSVRQVERGERIGASRLKGTGIGFVAGALTGLVVTSGMGSGCQNGCDDPSGDLDKAIGTAGGAVLGTLLGFTIGSQIPHYEWRRDDTPLRVGLVVRGAGAVGVGASLRH